MHLDMGSLIAGLLIAAFSAGMSAAATFSLFYFSREQQYHSTLSDQYGRLFSQYRNMRSSVLCNTNRHDAATEIYAAILSIQLIDRDQSRIEKLENIRAAAKVLAEHLPAWGVSTESDTQIQEQLNQFHETIEALIPKLRNELIANRPLKNFVT